MSYIDHPDSFYDLRQNLELCDKLFLEHQVFLMRRDTESALRTFEKLFNYRMIHLKMMELLLLPAFEKSMDKLPSGARIHYFLREKKRIEKELKNIVRLLSDMVLHNHFPDLVDLFEEYAQFKDLMDHHDAREKVFLFSALEEKLSMEEKHKLLEDVSGYLSKTVT